MRILRCAECGLPFLILQNGVAVVQSTHGGRKHRNIVSLAELLRLSQEDTPPTERVATPERITSALSA